MYDALGRLISVRDSSGCTTFSYNSKNKTSNVVYTNEAGESHQITYHYDIYSRETGYSVDGNRKTIISRLDNDGKISSMIIGRSNLHTNSFVWSYLPNSDLVSKIQYPCDYSTLYLYEENNKLIHKITNSSPTDNFSEVTYRYDSLFRQTSANNILYSYNSRGELASVRDGSDSTFIYDDIGNPHY